MKRPICGVCKRNACAVNYKRNDKTYYRSRCLACINKNRRIKPPEPRWRAKGYTQKSICDLCGFRARHGSQIHVYHIDGNLNNNEIRNLRSICLNCSAVVQRETAWKPGDLLPD